MGKKQRQGSLVRILICAFLCAIITTGLAVSVHATNYYVATSGDNNSSGSQGSPFATIQKGADVAQPGDTVFVTNGSYTGFTVRRGGSSDSNRIVFKSVSKHGAVIDRPSSDGSNCIGVYALTNCVPDGSKDYVTIEGFRIENAPYRGVSMFGTVGLEVRDCYIYNCKDGAQGSNNRDTVYENNVFDSNAKETQYYHQLYFSEGSCCLTSHPIGGYKIIGNVFRNAQVGETIHFMSHTPGYKHENVTIANNVFDHNASVDLSASSISNSHIYNNVFVTDYAGHGVITISQPGPLNCGTPESPENIHVYNNTIIATNTRGVYFRYVSSLGPNETTGCAIFNNIIVARSSEEGVVDNSVGTQYEATNLIYGANDSGLNTTLSNLFENYSAGDYRLKVGSQAIDAGSSGLQQVSAPSEDIAGNTRLPNAVDIGAYEHGAAPPPDEDLAAPQGVTLAETTLGCLDVAWQHNTEPSLAGYRVYYGTSSASYSDSVDTAALNTGRICELVGRYYVAVRAYSGSGDLSPLSSEHHFFVLGSTTTSALQVGYWNMDDGSGTTAADSWGGKNASLVDGAAWATSGAIAGAISLDGTNDRAEIAALDVPDGPGMSLALWCNADDFGTPDARLISKATGTAEQSHYWMLSTIDQTGLRFRLRTNGQTTTVQTAAGQLQAGRWYHIAAVYDGVAMRIYKDGVQVASSAKTGIVDVDAGIAVAIGNQPTGAGTLPFDGMIDDVRIYRRPLTPADITALINLRTNAAPVASFTASTTTGTAPVEVTFDATASSDPDGDPLSFAWDFDDGGTATGITASHTYSLAGSYDAILTVSDDHDNSDTHQVTINVGEQTTPPGIPSLQLVLEDDPGCVTVTWLPNGEPDLAGYTLYYGATSVEGGEAGAYDETAVLGAVTSWRSCSFGPGRYYFALRARNDAGQLSGYSAEVSLDVAGPDVVGPTIIPLDPSNGSSNIALQSDVRFVVVDDRSNVDVQNLTVRINGQVPSDMQLVPEPPGYAVTCVPAAAFAPNSQVVVDVTARDTAAQPNTGTRSWSFTTVSVPPAAPVGLTATGSTVGELGLVWGANQEPDLAGYRVYFGPAPRNYTDSLSVGLVTSYTVGGLADGTYYVALRARNAAGQMSGLSAESSDAVTLTVTTDPTPPQGVQVVESAPGCMRVTWQASNDPEVIGYLLFYSTLSVAQGETSVYFNTVDARNTTSYEVCDLSTNTYYVALRAYRSDNDRSGYSTEKNVKVSAPDQVVPTVTLAYPANGAVGVPQNVKTFLLFSDDHSGIDTTAVTVRIGNQTPSRVTFTGDPFRLGAVCELDGPLPASSVVSVDVTVSDLADSPNTTTRSWSFTTGNAADLAPPVFVSFSPADGSRDVDPSAEIVIQMQDDTALDAARTQLFIDGDEVEVATEDAGGGRLNVRRRQATLLPAGEVDVRVVAYDTADNRAELLFDFTVSGFEPELASDDPEGAIVPDGFWADDPDRPLEVRNLPVGWTVRIFTTAGVQVRSFENGEEEGMTWIWDFHNDHGQEVARALYLVRVVDTSGNVQQSGKFVARLTQ